MSLYAPVRQTNLDENNLDDWVRRSRAGEVEAFNRIVERFYGITYGMAFRMVGSRETAEDITQDVFLKAWRSISQFRGASRFSTWLHTIAVNQCLSVSRQQKRKDQFVEPVSLETWMENRPDSVEIADRGGFDPDDWAMNLALQDAIGKLPERLKITLILKYFAHYSVEEIAQALDLPPRTVRSRLHLAIKQLRCKLSYLEESLP